VVSSITFGVTGKVTPLTFVLLRWHESGLLRPYILVTLNEEFS
jgi:hypothetical protein